MLIKAILVAFVYYIGRTLNTVCGITHFNRPIILAPIVGLLLGDLKTGIMLGATFEAVFLGVIAVGASMPADPAIGAVFGTTVAILSGADVETALAIAMPVALLGIHLSAIPMNAIYPFTVPRIQKYSAEGNIKGVTRLAFIMGLLMYFFNAIAVFIGVYLGAETVGRLLNAMPEWVITGLRGAGSILPAVGMSLLLNMLFDKKVIAFFFLGFVLTTYLSLDSIAIAVVAVVIGLYTYFNMPKTRGNLTVAQGGNQTLEEEGFFDE